MIVFMPNESNRIIAEVNNIRKETKKIVWTNGCFDIIHKGHINYIMEARKNGNVLFLGLNDDNSIKRLKGPTRPINLLDKRLSALNSLGLIDYCAVFSSDSPLLYLQLIKPDVYVKGGDYNLDTINQDERKFVESYGGKIVIANYLDGFSTTKIIEANTLAQKEEK